MPAARSLVVLLLAAAAALCAACSPRAAEPGPAAVPAPAPRAAAFSYAPGARSFVAETRATITVAGDTAMAQDTVVTRTYVTYRIADGDAPRQLTGTVDSFTVQGGALLPAAGAPVTPLHFAGVADAGRITVATQEAAQSSCDTPAGTLLATAADLLPPFPVRLAAGARWADTVRATSCRGGLVVSTTAVHQYAVVAAGDAAAGAAASGEPTRVERASTILVSGAGEQNDEPVTITGQGVGRATFRLSVADGQLLDGRAESTLDLTFAGGGRTQQVVQRATQHVRPIAGPDGTN